jgi:simple sugar transport system ATP-binding protein
LGERQQLEIMRLQFLGARVIILDEPTTGISAAQKTKLFDTLKKFPEQAITTIFVSHKLEDVENLCDRVAVLRQGKLVNEMTRAPGAGAKPFNTNKLVEMMFGKEISLGARQTLEHHGCVISLQDLSIEDSRMKIQDVSLDVDGGEVIGLAGMEGSGQGAFLRACAGIVRPVGGHVKVRGRDLTGKSYHVYKRNGVEFLPAARLEEALVSGLSLTEHYILTESQRGVFIDRERGIRQAQKKIDAFNIKGTPVHNVESLSGGNQQRALLSLLRDTLSLVLVEHPTRGLDIESVIYIWGKLKERCRKGTAIIFMSSDLEEILQYSDRVLVFFSGKVSQPLDASTTTVEQLGQLIGGKGWAS